MKEKKRMKDFFELARYRNCFMAAIGVIVGGLVGAGLGLNISTIFLAFLAVVFITAGGNAMNDYFDQEVDAVSHKKRPIPSGRITSPEAIMFSATVFIVGLAFAVFISQICLFIVGVNIVLLISYDKYFKKRGLSGNGIVSYLTASVFLFGAAAVGQINSIGIIFLLAFLPSLGREIAKDVEDIVGDTGKRKTLPMRIGEGKALAITCFCVVVTIVLSFLPFYWQILGWGYAIVVILADIMFLSSIQAAYLGNAHLSQNRIKKAMFVALVAFVLGGVT